MTQTIKNKMNLKDMKYQQGFKFIEEIYDKNPLGSQDEVIFKETLHKLRQLYEENEQKVEWWNKIEEKLTAKQLLYVLKN